MALQLMGIPLALAMPVFQDMRLHLQTITAWLAMVWI
jgi:hypothetical protein